MDSRYDDRRSYGGRRHDDYRETDVSFRTGRGAPPVRDRESVVIKERDEVDRRTPAFLRDDYGQSSAGPMVLRARDREDVTYAPPRRRRSHSPESKREKEEIIVRREERSQSRPPAPRPRPREQSREREEIIIRRDERSESRPPAPRRRPRDESREREEIIIRRDERSEDRPAGPPYRERSHDREEIIVRRDEREGRDYAPPRPSTTAPARTVDREREEIIIRRDERDSRSRVDDDLVSHRSYQPPPPFTRNDVDRQEIIIRREQSEQDIPPARAPRRARYEDDLALSRPLSHERARGRSHSSASEEEIIIRREERDRGRGREDTRQEIIIRKSSRSRSPSPVSSVSARPPPAPPVIYAPQIHQEVITHHRHIDHGYEVRQPVYSRPPSPPSPPPLPPAPPSARELSEERIEIRRSDTRNGRTEDQDIVISRRERSRSAGPPAARYREEDEVDYYTDRQVAPAPKAYTPPPTVGPRYGARPDPRDRLWTEVTKDLVVKEAIKEMGYEFEETDEYYYIFKYMDYADVARLVGLSEDIKRERHKRINEIRWENEFAPSPRAAIAPSSPRAPLAIEGPPSRERPDSRGWNRDEERFVEREVVYRGGRPPPPPAWRY